jgi:hypothetical protein
LHLLIVNLAQGAEISWAKLEIRICFHFSMVPNVLPLCSL